MTDVLTAVPPMPLPRRTAVVPVLVPLALLVLLGLVAWVALAYLMNWAYALGFVPEELVPWLQWASLLNYRE